MCSWSADPGEPGRGVAAALPAARGRGRARGEPGPLGVGLSPNREGRCGADVRRVRREVVPTGPSERGFDLSEAG